LVIEQEENMENVEIATLADLTRVQARVRPEQQAMIYINDGRTWTFAQMDADANRVAQALAADGVGAHDLVAYLDKNAPEYFLYLYGGAKLNAVSVAVNWRLAPPEMEYVLNNSEAKVLVIGDEFVPALTQMDLEHVDRVVVLGDPGDSGHLTWDQWLAPHAPVDPLVPVTGADTCYQLYTSGTTGLPKGVELTHANFLHCLHESLGVLGMDSNSVNLVCMPLFHISGGAWGVLGAYWGAGTVLLRDVDLPTILRVIPEQKVTHTIFVPAVMQFLLSQPDIKDVDFSSLQSVTYGASPITEAVLVDAMETFGCDFVQAYGLTETTGGICLLLPEDHDPGGARAHLLRSCGKPVPNHEVKVFDPETLQPVIDGEVGEIWVKGPQNMKGYWKNPQATAKAFEDGWFRTGDAGYMREGYVYIHDRVKDMVISGGENIYPAEIENVLMRHDGVADAAVIGVPDERWGESVKAIITKADPNLTEQAVIEYCRSQLAAYKCPKSVDWMADIPRNPSGKILKTELRKPYWQGHERQVS
jgi:long-chain acyl-CoA synthetase